MLVLVAMLAHAKVAPNVAADPALEKHVLAITQVLRCLVCQNQTIADSHADLAIDLRNEVREKLVQGMSDQAVIDFMVQRYGDFVLYRPPVKATTWLLWFGPFLLLIGGLVFLGLKLKQRARDMPAAELSEDEMRRVTTLLGSTTESKE
ncbi:MAG TPA: cytochrome c-type biogenesis protein CcmH [Oxalobacteraceae bacterium]|jgi:cytochrome c-type biogenesis protein CcmH|nr:cytochrome c-type biogenesis protein CcmH [Oxalobacteraceae bacterium]